MKKLEEECFSFYCDHEKEEAEPEVFETTAGLENGRETFCLLETLESDPKPEILKAKMLYLNETINMAIKGFAAGPVVPVREWRELYAALDGAAVAAIHPFYTASIRTFREAGRPVIGSAPVGLDGTDAWLTAIADTLNVDPQARDGVRNAMRAAITGALAENRIEGRITLSGYEGSELIVARLLVESGADLRYVGTACPKTPYSAEDAAWLEAKGVRIQYRASLEQDLAAFAEYEPDLVIGTTPVVQAAKEASVPALYFTNLISARPLMGPAGAGSLAQVINAAIANKPRFDRMTAFFEGVGSGDTAGVWQDTPVSRPAFRKKYAAKTRVSKNAVDAGEAVGC